MADHEPTLAPSVTVVVPVFGDRGGLSDTLDALLDQDYDGSYDVVLVDNGDNAGSPVLGPGAPALPTAVPIRVVQEPAPGSYAARNAGLRTSSAHVLAFTDADCAPRSDWLSAGVAALLAAPQPCFVGGRIHLVRSDPRRASAAELYELALGFPQHDYVTQSGFAATANLLVRRAVLDRVGPFRGELSSGGDREWGERATRLGVRGVYAADAVVEHPCRRTLSELRRKVVRVTGGHAQVRRLRGEPEPAPRQLARELLPPVRTTARAARRVRGAAPIASARFVLVALYVHYLQLGLRLRRSLAPQAPSALSGGRR